VLAGKIKSHDEAYEIDQTDLTNQTNRPAPRQAKVLQPRSQGEAYLSPML